MAGGERSFMSDSSEEGDFIPGDVPFAYHFISVSSDHLGTCGVEHGLCADGGLAGSGRQPTIRT
jgi:hypothetical protein